MDLTDTEKKDSDQSVRIAMWSGPRNISTAMMRSWGSRPDTFVCDEPFYAHYLNNTDAVHPGSDEVIASQSTDWREVAAWLTGPVPEGKRIFFQKHMTHHMIDGMGYDWFAKVRHAFLIRDPRSMLISLNQKLETVVLRDTGLEEQLRLFNQVREMIGKIPPVIESSQILKKPRSALAALCDALGVPFTDDMLTWQPGRRDTDGVWAKYWYANVEASSGFQPYKASEKRLPSELEPLYRECMDYYQEINQYCLRS